MAQNGRPYLQEIVGPGWLRHIGKGKLQSTAKEPFKLELKQCNASTVVLRLVVDNKYCQQRKRHTQNTTNLAQMIASVQDTWRFQVVNASVITGFVRIANTESAEIPRSSSGSEYNGARWFVESLQPDAGAMQWVAWNGSEDVCAEMQTRGRHQGFGPGKTPIGI